MKRDIDPSVSTGERPSAITDPARVAPPTAPTGPAANGATRERVLQPPDQGTPAQSAPSRRGFPKLALLPLVLLILAGGAAVGYRFWYDSTHFVSTDNAQVAGYMVQVGALQAGRVSEVALDVGGK